MSHKLASAMVCIGITVGCLSAPKASKSNGAKRPITTTLGSVNAPLGAVTGALANDSSGQQQGWLVTNAFESSLQQ